MKVDGLVLAGGRGSRMGGVDKGLQSLHDRPLVAHAIERLRPQVSRLMISANRHLPEYRRFGLPVLSDADAGAFSGPLAGIAAGLAQCEGEWLMTIPCDCPLLPADLVARLLQAVQDCEAAVPSLADQIEPAFCLLRRTLLPSLQHYLAGGGRKVQDWLAALQLARVPFDDARAFVNANTLSELQMLEDARP